MTSTDANPKESHEPRVSFYSMQVVLKARGLRPKFNRLAVAQWIVNPNRKPQVVEARRLQITSRHFRRIVRELEGDISNEPIS
jgi:hypothetical protein